MNNNSKTCFLPFLSILFCVHITQKKNNLICKNVINSLSFSIVPRSRMRYSRKLIFYYMDFWIKYFVYSCKSKVWSFYPLFIDPSDGKRHISRFTKNKLIFIGSISSISARTINAYLCRSRDWSGSVLNNAILFKP